MNSFSQGNRKTPGSMNGRSGLGGGPPFHRGKGRENGGGWASLPDDYLKAGYFDDSGRFRKELFIGWPEQIVSGLKGKMSATALRKFFDEAKTILSVAEGQEDAFENVRHRVWKLKALVHNATKKKDSNTPFLFAKFIEANIPHAEQSLKAYKAFVLHFECIVAFFKE